MAHDDHQRQHVRPIPHLDYALYALGAAVVARLAPEVIAVELAEPGCFGSAESLAYIEGHNTAAMGRRDRRWAVAVPIILDYTGDPSPGDVIFPQRIALTACGS